MPSRSDELSILIVDDRPETLLALEAVLADLCPGVVTAASGLQALKCLLDRDYAVILLDVNMPGMDGFETASLIRQRRNSEHTPIIFVTAFGDDMHAARGYSLGAVDYILAPVVPEVLRSKVSFFLDLYKKTAEIERQARRMRRWANQLQKLTQASIRIHSALSMDEMLRVITDTARELVEGDQATTIAAWNQDWSKARSVVSRSQEPERGLEEASGQEIHALWKALNESTRLSRVELLAYPSWQNWRRDHGARLPEGAWLAAPLIDREERTIGLLHVSGKSRKDFTDDDQALMLQLAQMASIAVENMLTWEAREANRLKDEFLATLSHELRTPLTAILGWTQLLRTASLEADEAARGFEVIERNVMSQARLIEDLLDVSRIVTGKLQVTLGPVDLISVIHAALDVVRPNADAKKVRLVSQLDPTASRLWGDPHRLQQVVWNLLTNAIKFTPASGEVRIQSTRQGSEVVIEVADTGEGIHPDFLPHIFDRFRQADSTTRRSHGGLGLGLAIVRHVVELHGGSVRAASEGEGRGATFFVRLPIPTVIDQVEAAPDGQAMRADSEPGDLQGVQVMVVDDEPDGREIIARVLRRGGAEVTTAGSVREAVTLWEASVPDVLVTDIGMPDEDGYDLIRQVRQRAAGAGGNVPAMALTAFAREEDSARALAAGFQLHVSKPIDPGKLLALVVRLAGRTTPAGQRAAASRG